MLIPNMHIETQTLELADGRALAFCEFGDANGFPIFYAHGSPGSRIEGQIYHEKAKEYGLKLIVPDRPGFGQSSFQTSRRLLDYPKDIAELSDHLGIDAFGSIGHSGGGAYSIICRHALPDRTIFAMPLGGYTNFGEMAGAANFLKTKADRLAVSLSQSHPRLFQLFFIFLVLGVRYAPEYYLNALLQASEAADRAIVQGGNFKEILIDDQREALVQGGAGAALDCAILYSDWGISLKDIPGKVVLFQGTEDRLVPIEFARHLAANIPDSSVTILEGQGHLFPWQQQDLIFQTVLEWIGP